MEDSTKVKRERDSFPGPDKSIITLLLFILLAAGQVKAQVGLEVIRGESNNNSLVHFSDAPNALYHHLAGQAYGLLDSRAGRISELGSLSDWRDRQDEIRSKLTEIVGPFPEKTKCATDTHC